MNWLGFGVKGQGHIIFAAEASSSLDPAQLSSEAFYSFQLKQS